MTAIRRQRLKQELREEILSAARDLFVKEGYESVSMRKIADKGGFAPGTIYLYFEDKDAILTGICIETFAKLDARMNAIANDKGDPLERLRRGGRQYIQFGLDHPHHYLITFGGHGASAMDMMKAKQAGFQCFDCLRRSVRDCIDAGLLRKLDVEEVAQSLWAAMHGLVMLLITKEAFPFIERSRLIESLLDTMIEGIRAR